MNRLPPLFVVLRKAFDPEFKRQMEESRKKHEKIEAEYQASKKPSPSLPPMGGSKKTNIHEQAAYHITSIHRLDLSDPGNHTKAEPHWNALRDLLRQGAKPSSSHFFKVGSHYQRRFRRHNKIRDRRANLDKDHAYRMSYAAHHLARNDHYIRHYIDDAAHQDPSRFAARRPGPHTPHPAWVRRPITGMPGATVREGRVV